MSAGHFTSCILVHDPDGSREMMFLKKLQFPSSLHCVIDVATQQVIVVSLAALALNLTPLV